MLTSFFCSLEEKIRKQKRTKSLKNKLKKSITAFFIVFFSFSVIVSNANVSQANWLNDWYDNVMTSSSGVNYFEGQKRGYVTFGSFSARLPIRTDYLFSIEKPHLKVGCGGIDLFMGGFSFLNADYLVQKVQAMLQAAPFIAFDIALQTLFPEGSEILKKAESIIDLLNQIQISECGIYVPKGIVDIAKSPTEFFKTQGEARSQTGMSKGVTDLWHNFWKRFVHVTDNDISIEGVSPNEALKGLGPDLKDWILNYSSMSFTSYLASKGYTDPTVAAIFRAYVGDLRVQTSSDKNVVNVALVPECKEANVKDVFLKGTIYKQEGNHCTAEDANRLMQKVENAIINSLDVIKTKGRLSSDTEALLRNAPMPLYLYVKTSAVVKDPALVYSIAPVVSKGLIYAGLLDLVKKMRGILVDVECRARLGQNVSPDGKEVMIMVNESVSELKNNVNNFERVVQEQYANVVGELSQRASQTIAYLQFDAMVKKTFGVNKSLLKLNVKER